MRVFPQPENAMKTLISEEQLRQGIDRIATEICEHYRGRPLTIVGVLIGSVVFLSDLIRRLDLPLRLDLVQAASYRGGSTRPGPLVLNLDMLSTDIRGRDVLLVDDIFDTGKTLWELLPQLDDLGPSSIRTAVLLRKKDRCEVPIRAALRGVRHSQRICGRLRPGLSRPASQFALFGRIGAGRSGGVRAVTPPRVVMVAQRFWPRVGALESAR